MKDGSIKLDSNTRIKVLGDSLAAGRGASDCAFDGPFIITCNGRNYYEQSGERCWAGILKTYIAAKYPGAELVNFGTNSTTSFHLHKYMHSLIEPEDTVVMIMIGANNRKVPVGMGLLASDLSRVIKHILEWGKEPVLLTPVPTTKANENRGDRRFRMSQVDDVIKSVAKRYDVPCISMYDYLKEHAKVNHMTIEELMLPREELSQYRLPDSTDQFTVNDWNRVPDGLHPPDSVHRLIAKHIADTLGW